jgi:hypothetical protein
MWEACEKGMNVEHTPCMPAWFPVLPPSLPRANQTPTGTAYLPTWGGIPSSASTSLFAVRLQRSKVSAGKRPHQFRCMASIQSKVLIVCSPGKSAPLTHHMSPPCAGVRMARSLRQAEAQPDSAGPWTALYVAATEWQSTKQGNQSTVMQDLMSRGILSIRKP